MCSGNTTMNHLFTGFNANYLRMEPFIPVFFETDGILGKDLNLLIHPMRKLIAPNIGSYVARYYSGYAGEHDLEQREYSLFVDLGTNGELVFGKGFL